MTPAACKAVTHRANIGGSNPPSCTKEKKRVQYRMTKTAMTKEHQIEVIVENADIIRKLAKVNDIFVNIEDQRYRVLKTSGIQQETQQENK